MKILVASMALALAVAGCTAKSASKEAQNVDLNAAPANYRTQIATFLRTELDNRDDFRSALIGTPTLKPVGASQRIVVCLQFTRRPEHKDKVVIFLAGSITQYVDSKPEQCADAVFQPFGELADMIPR
jgi:hypothetical protein